MSSVTILVADDSSTVRHILQRILTEAGYQVVLASDGVQAVDLAIEYRPAMAILDIIMPVLDGYGVVEVLKDMDCPLNQIPILFLTCVNSGPVRLLGKQYGMYLRKPIDREMILAAVARQLSKVNAATP